METGTKNRCVIEVTHFLGKIKSRAFPERVGPRILSLQSVDYFGTSEHYWVVEEKQRLLISKTAMVGCCKLSLFADGSCDENAVYFRWWFEDTLSTHRYTAKSAEFPPKCFRITTNLFCCSVAVVASRCRVSSHLLVFFFLRCLVEMLVNAGQEMDSARDCKYKFSFNLVMRKPEYRRNPVNYRFGIQFILLLSILRTLRHKWLSTLSVRIYCFCLSVLTSLLLLLRRLQKTSKN